MVILIVTVCFCTDLIVIYFIAWCSLHITGPVVLAEQETVAPFCWTSDVPFGPGAFLVDFYCVLLLLFVVILSVRISFA